MKLILSRKGLDSSFGPVANPILPDGTLCWLPIPEIQPNKPDLLPYKSLQFEERNLGDMMETLSKKRTPASTRAHLDPDLYAPHRPRPAGWRPIFGQTGPAEKHLQNEGVGPGDIFLYFGWFRAVEETEAGLRFIKNAPDLHVLYGWLQVHSRVDVADRGILPEWAYEHPHVQGKRYGNLDSVYLSTPQLTLGGQSLPMPGGGLFKRLHENLVLTAPGASRSLWKLPRWFFPMSGQRPLTYHDSSTRWQLKDDHCLLQSVGRGQEFVLDTATYPEAENWALNLIQRHGGR